MNIRTSRQRFIHLMIFGFMALSGEEVVRLSLKRYSQSLLQPDRVPIAVSKSIGDLAQAFCDPLDIPDEERLTVEETVSMALGAESSPEHFLKHSNPKAIPELWKLLEIEDDGIWMIHRSSYEILGYIGDDADAARMVSKLRSYHGVLNAADSGLVSAIISTLGHMGCRGVATAVKSLGEMSDVSYWKGRFQYLPENLRGEQFLPPELETVCRVLIAQAYGRWNEWQPQFQILLSQIENNKHRKMMALRFELHSPSQSVFLADEVLKGRKPVTEKQRQALRWTYERREEYIKSTSKAQREMGSGPHHHDWLRLRPLPK